MNQLGGGQDTSVARCPALFESGISQIDKSPVLCYYPPHLNRGETVSDWLGSQKSIQASSAKFLSLRLSPCLWFEGYFYFTYFPGIGPMLDAGGSGQK
jgi:hypothetical protein